MKARQLSLPGSCSTALRIYTMSPSREDREAIKEIGTGAITLKGTPTDLAGAELKIGDAAKHDLR